MANIHFCFSGFAVDFHFGLHINFTFTQMDKLSLRIRTSKNFLVKKKTAIKCELLEINEEEIKVCCLP